jgi:predicted nucleic acid-binding protein
VICYFDTSAFVPILIDEPSSSACAELWNTADAVTTTRLLYVETSAALARAHRSGRVSSSKLTAAQNNLDELWPEFDVIELGAELTHRAAELAMKCSLRGYDAVHCAAAEQLADDGDLVAATGGKALLTACHDLGISTADINHPDYL